MSVECTVLGIWGIILRRFEERKQQVPPLRKPLPRREGLAPVGMTKPSLAPVEMRFLALRSE
jgi:hypothetical protein